MSLNERMRGLEALKGSQLREKFREVVGVETKSNNKPYLIKKIAAELYKKEQKEKAVTEAKELSAPAAHRTASTRPAAPKPVQGRPRRKRDPRLPPVGTPIAREYRGQIVQTVEQEDGTFTYNGKPLGSLSKVAAEITGTIWNGFVFFKEGLLEAKERAKQEAAAAASSEYGV